MRRTRRDIFRAAATLAAVSIAAMASACRTTTAPSGVTTAGAGVVELSGHDQSGPQSCPALSQGRTCVDAVLQRHPLYAACTAAGGSVLICEDCSPLCSVPVEKPPEK